MFLDFQFGSRQEQLFLKESEIARTLYSNMFKLGLRPQLARGFQPSRGGGGAKQYIRLQTGSESTTQMRELVSDVSI